MVSVGDAIAGRIGVTTAATGAKTAATAGSNSKRSMGVDASHHPRIQQ